MSARLGSGSVAVDEEVPTVPIRRGRMSAHQLSTQEAAGQGAADPVAVDAKKVVREMELAENETDAAQAYRMRVAEAQLPDDVRLAALREVGKLERTSDQSPESHDIRNWLDTMLGLPWTSKIIDSIDIQGSREDEARLQRLIEPTIADVEEGDPAEVERAVADLEEGEAAEVDPAEVDTTEVDREKELAENETDRSQDFDPPVEEAQLPDHVPEAALREVGKLEPNSDQSPESDDTMPDLPWSTEIRDSIDIQVSREDEARLHRLIEPVASDVETGKPVEIEPVAADLEEGDTAKVDPAAADSENAHRAPAGPLDDDTVETLAVLSGFSGGGHPGPQLQEQQVVRPAPVETPPKKRRSRSLALAATALAVLLIGALLLAVDRDRGVTAQSGPTVTATATATVSKATGEPSDESTGAGGEESAIKLEDFPKSAKPSQTVRIQGRFPGGADTFLRVQRWEAGKWQDFPLTPKTDESGRFTAYVDLPRPGSYSLRVLDPDSLVTSKTFVVVING
jgi:hypothetical protein